MKGTGTGRDKKEKLGKTEEQKLGREETGTARAL